MTKIAGSGSMSQRHGSPDPDPDPLQNVMDPQHCFKYRMKIRKLFLFCRRAFPRAAVRRWGVPHPRLHRHHLRPLRHTRLHRPLQDCPPLHQTLHQVCALLFARYVLYSRLCTRYALYSAPGMRSTLRQVCAL